MIGISCSFLLAAFYSQVRPSAWQISTMLRSHWIGFPLVFLVFALLHFELLLVDSISYYSYIYKVWYILGICLFWLWHFSQLFWYSFVDIAREKENVQCFGRQNACKDKNVECHTSMSLKFNFQCVGIQARNHLSYVSFFSKETDVPP